MTVALEGLARLPDEDSETHRKRLMAALDEGIVCVLGPTDPVDPLDVTYDGVPLRDLLEIDMMRRREQDLVLDHGVTIEWRSTDPWTWTSAQRAAISAHWSAELRAKVAAKTAADRERERTQICVDIDID